MVVDVDLREKVSCVLERAKFAGVGRAVNMGVFEFITGGGEEAAIHAQCAFRVLVKARVALGSRDILYQRGEFDPYLSAESWYDNRANKMNVALSKWLPEVVGVDLGLGGLLRVVIVGGLAIELFPDVSRRDESWRVFVRNSNVHHIYPLAQEEDSLPVASRGA